MTVADQPLSPFELAATELRALGIALARLPGEYRVNFRNGSDAIARMAETLGEALELGRSMAADAPAGPAHGKRRRRPRRMTPKAYNRGIMAQVPVPKCHGPLQIYLIERRSVR